jgi:crotonobetainyl-CoA:carnitine CoA-transferase CaiB-like acyl-CoA transferase
MLAVGNDRLYRELARRLELPDDDRFETNSSRVLHREELAALVQERLGREPTGVWLERLDSIPIAPVQTIREAAEHPQTLALGMLQAFAGRQRLAEPLRVDGERVRVDTPPPALGEH